MATPRLSDTEPTVVLPALRVPASMKTHLLEQAEANGMTFAEYHRCLLARPFVGTAVIEVPQACAVAEPEDARAPDPPGSVCACPRDPATGRRPPTTSFGWCSTCKRQRSG